MQVWHDGKLQQYIYPGRQFYANFGNQPASIISITTYGLTDLYVFLAEWTGPAEATIRVFVNPLVPLVWLGGLVMVLGGIICWWPERRRRRVVFSEAVGEPEAEPAMAGAARNGGGTPGSSITQGVLHDGKEEHEGRRKRPIPSQLHSRPYASKGDDAKTEVASPYALKGDDEETEVAR